MMKLEKRVRIKVTGRLLVALAASTSLAAAADTQPAAPPPAITSGMVVKDTSGGVVGIVTSVDGAFVNVKTDRYEARLPKTSFTPEKNALLFAMTQQQLNETLAREISAAGAALVPGVVVTGLQGAVVGTLDSIDADFATLKLSSGQLVKIPRAGLAIGPQGAYIGTTATALESQISGSTAASTASH